MISLVTSGWRKDSEKPTPSVTDCYKGGQPKHSDSGLLPLRPSGGGNKNVTGKLSSFFHRPTGRDTWTANKHANFNGSDGNCAHFLSSSRKI